MPARDKGKHIGRNKIVTGIDSGEGGQDRLRRGYNIGCNNGRLVGGSLRYFSMSK